MNVKKHDTQVWGVFQLQVLINCIKALCWIYQRYIVNTV